MSAEKSIHTVNTQNFDAEVLRSELPVLVKFTTPWCPPCKVLAPIVDALARDFAGRLKVVEIDGDDDPDIATRYRVRGFPTVILFERGVEVGRQLGAVPRAKLVALIETPRGMSQRAS